MTHVVPPAFAGVISPNGPGDEGDETLLSYRDLHEGSGMI